MHHHPEEVAGAASITRCSRRSDPVELEITLPLSLLNPPRFRFAPLLAKAGERRIAAMGCQALQSTHRWVHTHFCKRFQLSETGRQTRCCQRQLPMCFGRIALQVKPYSSVSPSWLSSPTGATRVGRPRGSPFRLPLLRNVAPLSLQDG